MFVKWRSRALLVSRLLSSQGRKFISQRRCRYGPVFRTHLLGSPTVVVVGPAYVRRVLIAEESTLGQTSPGNFERLLGPGALTSTRSPTEHKRLRNVVARTLTSRKNLSSLADAIQRIVRAEVSTWAVNHGSREEIGRPEVRDTTDIPDRISHCSGVTTAYL